MPLLKVPVRLANGMNESPLPSTSICSRSKQPSETHPHCGVRVVQGAHRAYMTDFIRDPKTGGCAAGVPPANLGFRLVVEPSGPVVTSAVRSAAKLLRRT